ncbi:MAG: hypothetical protein A3J38_10680 [Gammaproteobacteria bacterium RIFCSPHIGHO2_12_FULL_45_9]|nr:MAG: hypothetical protein A3J38_10680 [Gammaproteobacteria bacterium RIFCSPHIGHO2_12_FULL_45_9]
MSRDALSTMFEGQKLTELTEAIEAKISKAFTKTVNPLTNTLLTDSTRQASFTKAYTFIRDTCLQTLVTAAALYIGFRPSVQDKQESFADAPYSRFLAYAAVHQTVVATANPFRDGFKNLLNGASMQRTANAIALNLPKNKIDLTLTNLTIQGMLLTHAQGGLLSTKAPEIFAPYFLGYSTTNAESIFTDSTFRWFHYATEAAAREDDKSTRDSIIYAKRGFIRYAGKDRTVTSHRTSRARPHVVNAFTDGERTGLISPSATNLFAVTDPGDHLTKVWLGSNLQIATPQTATTKTTWWHGSNTPWKQLANLFSTQWGSSQAEWSRRQLYVSWLIIHKMFELRTETPLPLLLLPTQAIAENCVRAILDVLELASLIPGFQGRSPDQNMLLWALNHTPMVQLLFTHAPQLPTDFQLNQDTIDLQAQFQRWHTLMHQAWNTLKPKAAYTDNIKTYANQLYVGHSSSYRPGTAKPHLSLTEVQAGTSFFTDAQILPDQWCVNPTLLDNFAQQPFMSATDTPTFSAQNIIDTYTALMKNEQLEDTTQSMQRLQSLESNEPTFAAHTTQLGTLQQSFQSSSQTLTTHDAQLGTLQQSFQSSNQTLAAHTEQLRTLHQYITTLEARLQRLEQLQNPTVLLRQQSVSDL